MRRLAAIAVLALAVGAAWSCDKKDVDPDELEFVADAGDGGPSSELAALAPTWIHPR